MKDDLSPSNQKGAENEDIRYIIEDGVRISECSDCDKWNDDKDNEEHDVDTQKSCFKRYLGSIRGGSLRGSVFAMASITFGTGCLSFPAAIKAVGPVFGFGIFVLVLLQSYWTLHLLIKAARKLKRMDYNDLIVLTIGNGFRLFSDINNILLSLGTIMSYQYTIAAFSSNLAKDFFEYNTDGTLFKAFQMFGCMLIIQIPLSLLKNMSKLQYASIVGVITLFYVILVVTIEMPFYLKNYLEDSKPIIIFPEEIGFKFLDAFAIFTFGFSSHNGIFPIYQELSRPSKKRMYRVLNRAVWIEVVLYLLVAYAGYFSTFAETPDVFIRRPNLPGFEKDYFIIIGKILLIICLHCTMAINYNIFRQSYKFMFFENQDIPFYIEVITAFVVYIGTNLLTYFIKDITDIFNFIGGICAITITTFNPIMIDIYSSGKPPSSPSNILKFMVLVIFSVLAIAATVRSIAVYL